MINKKVFLNIMKYIKYYIIVIIFIVVLLFMLCISNSNDNTGTQLIQQDETKLDSLPKSNSTLESQVIESTHIDKTTYYKSKTPNLENLKLFNTIIKKLIESGFDEDYVNQIFSNPAVVNIPSAIDVNMGDMSKMSEMRKYALTPFFINLLSMQIDASSFNTIYDKHLTSIQERYGVAREAIIGIIWVESSFGKDLGIFSVFNVYASIALYLDNDILKDRVDSIIKNNTKLKEEAIKNSILSKANWAFTELKCLLTMDQKTNLDILKVLGSYAGAFGFPQFLPSSYLKLAVDGNSDGTVDLFNIFDAMESVANYLSKAGWKTDDKSSQSSAILAYNHSVPYLIEVVYRMKTVNPSYQLDISALVVKYNANIKLKDKLNYSPPAVPIQNVLRQELSKQILLNNKLF